MKRIVLTLLIQCSLFSLPAMSQTLKDIYNSIPDTIVPRIADFQPEITTENDSIILFEVNKVKCEMAKYSEHEVVLLITLPLPEPDTRAYLYNISSNSENNRLIWKEIKRRDFADGEFSFAEAKIKSVTPLTADIIIREPFTPSDEEKEPKTLNNVKVF